MMKFRTPIPVILSLLIASIAIQVHGADAHAGKMSTADAILKKEHTVILKVVNAVRQDVEALRKGETVSSSRIEMALDFFTNFADACHHRKEENHYFPEVERQGEAPQHIMVSSFLNDHALYRVLLDKVRAGISGETVDASVAGPLGQYLSAVSLHICRENMFFGKAEPWLQPDQETALLEKFQQVEADLGLDFHQKYSRIASELAGH